jgi:hypothetical protein
LDTNDLRIQWMAIGWPLDSDRDGHQTRQNPMTPGIAVYPGGDCPDRSDPVCDCSSFSSARILARRASFCCRACSTSVPTPLSSASCDRIAWSCSASDSWGLRSESGDRDFSPLSWGATGGWPWGTPPTPRSSSDGERMYPSGRRLNRGFLRIRRMQNQTRTPSVSMHRAPTAMPAMEPLVSEFLG